MSQDLKLRPELMDSAAIVQWKNQSIQTQADAETFGNYIKIIADRKKEIKTEADKVKKPLKEALKRFESMVKNALEPLETTDKYLRAAVGRFWDQRQKEIDEQARLEREKEAKRLEAESKKAMNEAVINLDHEALQKAKNLETASKRELEKDLKNKQTMRLSTGTIAQQTKYEWVIEDATKIPLEYFILDEKKVNTIARGYKTNPIDIPGIKFIKKSIVSVR